MKHLRFALVAFASSLGFAFAQDEERRGPPVEIPDFSNLDEYIYEPKSTVTFGFRYISGAKTSFGGQGKLVAPEDPGAATGANILRSYHNGSVQPDGRLVARTDASGNPVIDPDSGARISDPIAPDGRTNSWSFLDSKQVTPDGYIAFHTYAAEIVDTGLRKKDSNSSAGMDIAVHRDMGKWWNGRLAWDLTAGMSINDIAANTNDRVGAMLRTQTDYYSLFGQRAPEGPYSAPSSSTETALDASGNPVLNDDGSVRTITTDTTVLLGNQPAARTITNVFDDTRVSSRWSLKGAYYTFRVGPTLWIPITTRLRASISAGAAVVYSGSTYTVTQTLEPEFGAEISDTSFESDYKLLPGYYVDASLQFDLTERAGFYAGAVFQSAGSYTQNVETASAQYSTKIDLANQNGVRAGMSIRF